MLGGHSGGNLIVNVASLQPLAQLLYPTSDLVKVDRLGSAIPLQDHHLAVN